MLWLPHGGWLLGGCHGLWISRRVLWRVCLRLVGHGLVLGWVGMLWERAQDAWD